MTTDWKYLHFFFLIRFHDETEPLPFFFQSSQFNKLEKADILELTVKHLRSLQDHHQQQQQHASQLTSDATLNGKYQAGFMECANEVVRYLGQSQSLADDVKSRVIRHLASCIQLSSKVSFSKPIQPSNTAVTFSKPQQSSTAMVKCSSMAGGPRNTNSQLVNGQIVHIVNNQFQNMKPSNGSFAGTQPVAIAPAASSLPVSSAPTHIPVAMTPLSANATSSAEPSNCVRYTQPLQIQIPPVLSPVAVQPRAIHQQKQSQSQGPHRIQEVAPHVIPNPCNPQESLISSNSPALCPRERSLSPLPLRANQRPHAYYHKDDTSYINFPPRSRTYSLTSSSSESELTSPLNLSQSPQFYDTMDINNNKYTGSQTGHYNQSTTQSDRLSQSYPFPRDAIFPSQCPSSNCTSVIVDGRKTSDSHVVKYIHFMDEERYFIRHEGSESPASSVGEERLWRPW